MVAHEIRHPGFPPVVPIPDLSWKRAISVKSHSHANEAEIRNTFSPSGASKIGQVANEISATSDYAVFPPDGCRQRKLHDREHASDNGFDDLRHGCETRE